jgi:REP element-mobilizing transposase RayT
MPRHSRQLSGTSIYHVMLRGVNRDAIFLEVEDYERFLHALARTRELSGCSVLAYCLMTNHVHLVVRTADEPIGDVVRRLGVRYAGWFNEKYGRVGHLFQDRFRSVPVETDAQLVTLVRYVWNNPLEAGIAERAEDYPWSSRRFLDGGSSLVDTAELRALLPPDALTDSSRVPAVQLSVFENGRKGRPRRHTDVEVGRLLWEVCGAGCPEDFSQLGLAAQRSAVRELRTRSVTYDQLAGATGMSASAVRRLHIAGRTDSSTSA